MAENSYTYILVGGGMASASAIQGIRQYDGNGSILLIGNEEYLPYNRPPLTKGLWFGKKQLDDIYAHQNGFYAANHVDTALNTDVVRIFPDRHEILDSHGKTYQYTRLLLATGGTPRKLDIPGGTSNGICYYRYLDDYRTIRDAAKPNTTAIVIGGSFIGSEIAAALCHNQVKVTMVFPDDYLVSRVFPESLGKALQSMYQQRGITILNNDVPVSFNKENDRFLAATRSGQQLAADMLIVGVGITPNIQLAHDAGLATSNGIDVNEFLQTSNSDIFAAGDNAHFPYLALGQDMRVEHWDNAVNQGLFAGRNMAGAQQQYAYMPYFFSDLFEFGYEAVGDVSTKLQTFADWQKENDTGVIYYLQDGKVRGAMMCNVWNQVNAARELIKSGQQWTPDQLRGKIGQQKAA
ncbi:MAG TPA: FAD-dependent oxidoreductase [Armatimonadota bacterium]|nr:FAD-dependent oxidoreductase [Armatimonadota bacterium]